VANKISTWGSTCLPYHTLISLLFFLKKKEYFSVLNKSAGMKCLSPTFTTLINMLVLPTSKLHSL
jgi:hypothetical protein